MVSRASAVQRIASGRVANPLSHLRGVDVSSGGGGRCVLQKGGRLTLVG